MSHQRKSLLTYLEQLVIFLQKLNTVHNRVDPLILIQESEEEPMALEGAKQAVLQEPQTRVEEPVVELGPLVAQDPQPYCSGESLPSPFSPLNPICARHLNPVAAV